MTGYQFYNVTKTNEFLQLRICLLDLQKVWHQLYMLCIFYDITRWILIKQTCFKYCLAIISTMCTSKVQYNVFITLKHHYSSYCYNIVAVKSSRRVILFVSYAYRNNHGNIKFYSCDTLSLQINRTLVHTYALWLHKNDLTGSETQ